MPAIWHPGTNSYLWHIYLDHREGVYWERHGVRTHRAILSSVSGTDISGIVCLVPLTVYEGDLE